MQLSGTDHGSMVHHIRLPFPTLQSSRPVGLARCAGAIGTEAARIWKGFGTRVLAYDVRPNPALDGVVEYVELEALLREAHLVTLHCPLLPSTFHLLNAERCAANAHMHRVQATCGGSTTCRDAHSVQGRAG